MTRQIGTRPTTRVACQAALATAVIVALSFAASLDYPIFAILTSIMVLSASWGESLRGAIIYGVTTLFGVAAGYFLFLGVGAEGWLHSIVAFALVAAFAYALNANDWANKLAMGMIVGLILPTVFGPQIGILEARVYEAFIGGAIAALISAVVFPTKAVAQASAAEVTYLGRLGQATANILDEVRSGRAQKVNVAHIRSINAALAEVDRYARATLYEATFLGVSRSRFRARIALLAQIGEYVTDLAAVRPDAAASGLGGSVSDELADIATVLARNFERTASVQSDGEPGLTDLEPKLNALRGQLVRDFAKTETMRKAVIAFAPLVYYLSRINAILQDYAAARQRTS
jgi:uncharacterized membrane protein YccC